ncbi:MAG: hypothetical protein JO353_08075 [Phycisphaerae bacterium]|nr:hypothetical protein [Phycisphaerae bacterium]
MLVKQPDFKGKFKTYTSDNSTYNPAASFILDYLKNTNPTVKNGVHHDPVIHPDTKGQAVSSTFRLIITEPTDVFAPFPTTYVFSLNSKHPLNLFSIKQTDSKGETMVFTGTYTVKTKTISGTLKITGKNRAEDYSYSVAATK